MSKKGIFKAGILGAIVGAAGAFFAKKENREMVKDTLQDAHKISKDTAGKLQDQAAKTVVKAQKASEEIKTGIDNAKESWNETDEEA